MVAIPKSDARRLLIDAERELVERGGLRAFIKLAWREVEPNTLMWNWHIDAMAEHLEAVSRGGIRKLLINVPPGCCKTKTVGTMWPAWDWAVVKPDDRFIFATYAQDLSDTSAKEHRDLVASQWFRERWGDLVSITDEGMTKVRLFENDRRGWRFSTSVGGQVTGRHGDKLVFDDLVKAQDADGRAAIDALAIRKANDFWFKTMATRQRSPATTAKIGIMQRLHYDDTAARCIEDGYVHLNLPMEYDPARKCIVDVTGWEDPRAEPGELLWPERFPRDEVESLKTTLGAMAAAAQLDQSPSPAGGAIFKDHTLHQRWEDARDPRGGVPYQPAQLEGRRMHAILTVDCSFKDGDASDYVVIQSWAYYKGAFFLLDQHRDRMDIVVTVESVRAMSEKWNARGVYIEDRANGPAVIQMLRGKVSGVNAWPPKGERLNSKEARANAVVPLFDAGDVYLPPKHRAPWLDEYVAEMKAFPVGRHDDQVDATTMALLILSDRKFHARDAAAWAKAVL